MQLKEAKIRFDAGCFKGVALVEAFMQKGYNLQLLGTQQSDSAVLSSQRADSQPKVFKSADAAIKAAADIGFREVVVRLSQ